MASTRQAGHMVGGRYRLVAELGSGGFGRVWQARDEILDVDVAVKELRLLPGMSETEQADRLVRAAREARNAARLRSHENIVAVHDVVLENDIPWIVMEFVKGCSLEEHLRAHGPLSVEKAANVATALLRAIGAAHEEGVVHRDIKPANVLLAENGKVLLTDFGIAVHHADTTLTATGMLVGSLEYMAPERVQGRDGLAASDLFSLGVTLYQAVEGVSPFHRDTLTATLAAVLVEQAPAPQRAGRLSRLITRLLDKDPHRRPTIPEALAVTSSGNTAVSSDNTEPLTDASREVLLARAGGAMKAVLTQRIRQLAAEHGLNLEPTAQINVRSPKPTKKIEPRPTRQLTEPRPPKSSSPSKWQKKGVWLLMSLIVVLGVAELIALAQEARYADTFFDVLDRDLFPGILSLLPMVFAAVLCAGIARAVPPGAGQTVKVVVGAVGFLVGGGGAFFAIGAGTAVLDTEMTRTDAFSGSLIVISVIVLIAAGWAWESRTVPPHANPDQHG